MTRRILRLARVRLGALLFLPLVLAGGTVSCNDLLDVADPTAVLEKDVNNPDGAERLRRAVYYQLDVALGHGPAFYSGLLADEFRHESHPNVPQLDNAYLDSRQTGDYAADFDEIFAYPHWQDMRGLRTAVAIEKLRDHALPGAREAHVGEMYAVRGFATMRLGEHYCPGFPLHEVANYKIISYTPPLSTEQVFERALAAFDTAVSWAADSARVLNFARIGRGRTLLNLGRFSEASATVTDVATDYVFQSAASRPVLTFILQGIADGEGGTGLDFVSADDPRVPKAPVRTAWDGSTTYHPTQAKPALFVSGVEARLIEGEAALRANQPQWLSILNALRTAGPDGSGGWTAGTGGVAGLAPLGDPGTAAARLDLVYRERAFWLFGTGSRLGDLRRLVSIYGRPVESVFPAGDYWQGGTYGVGTSLPFSKLEAELSPGVTGCTGL